MFGKKDVWIIAGVLLLAAAVFGVLWLTQSGESLSGMVEIYTEGVLYASAPLNEPQEIRVEQPDGQVNVVSIDGQGVRMASASCDNQDCVDQGLVTQQNWTRRALGRTIVCLPNRVLVELALEADHPALQEEDIPDI